MFYFVTSWYGNNLSFDDTVNQIKMFQSAGEDVELIVPNYITNLQHFLHQQDLSGVNLWRAFDDIQNTQHVGRRVLNFEDLQWPKEAEFIYTPFYILVLVDNQKYAQINFGETAYLSEITYFKAGVISHNLRFDSRGFVSSLTYYQGGEKSITEYFDRSGVWQIRHDEHTQSVTVNPDIQSRFLRSHYDSLQELVSERLTQYFGQRKQIQQGILIMAADPQNQTLIFDLPVKPERIVTSFFEPRNGPDWQLATFEQAIFQSKMVILDSEEKRQTLVKQITEDFNLSQQATLIDKMHHLSPYDARLELGTSQRYKKLYVLVILNQLDASAQTQMIDEIIAYVRQKPTVQVNFSTADDNQKAQATYVFEQKLANQFDLTIEEVQQLRQVDEKKDENKLDEASTQVDETEQLVKRLLGQVTFQTFNSEDALIREFRRTRLLVDLSLRPEILTQIAGISAGIPQINQVVTPYVLHQKNGLIIHNMTALSEALDYYLVGLSHWNEALVHSVQQIQKYNDGAIVKQWQAILKEVE